MSVEELSNEEWSQLVALLSDEPVMRLNRRGRPRAEPRIVANAVLWILATGEPWSKLPGRFPSGPTCRRRFEEWQRNGTLAGMVRILSQNGRQFPYIPELDAPPLPRAVEAPVACVRDEGRRDDGAFGVYWRSPESWQASGAVAETYVAGQPADPFATITRQLAGQDGLPVAVSVPPPSRAGAFGVMPNAQRRVPVPPAMPARSPLVWSSQASLGEQIVNRYGYLVHALVHKASNDTYRAAVEITRDGKRVERSGLIGPRFDHAEAARCYALDWAQQWIDADLRVHNGVGEPQRQHECVAQHAPAMPAATLDELARQPVALQPDQEALEAVKAVATLACVPDTMNVNGRWVPLKRYPSERVPTLADGEGDPGGSANDVPRLLVQVG